MDEERNDDGDEKSGTGSRGYELRINLPIFPLESISSSSGYSPFYHVLISSQYPEFPITLSETASSVWLVNQL